MESRETPVKSAKHRRREEALHSTARPAPVGGASSGVRRVIEGSRSSDRLTCFEVEYCTMPGDRIRKVLILIGVTSYLVPVTSYLVSVLPISTLRL